ncbi:MAG: hypothetical protein A2X86_02915 [Bdellovibrionales bacterium GWA2_49_15]|nr:MAG: hypothetical protein A2X86_02915 [Bdellovibrionales bacterium GWA2_49_15]HAZ14109.1 nitrate reductase [Bdellovibrionales bacterium]
MNLFLFVGLPYASIFIMLIGSVFIYNNREYRFSSLSTQLLESNGLHKGANLFHAGLIFLFFGHLTAFVFPASVLHWNADQFRLIVLEVSATGFALAALFGVIVLAVRRLKNERIRVVTSKLDILVYVLLITQIISGLVIAYYHRWGSSWFASTLTPYLYSLFTLSPDIKAIEIMPISVKIHIVSASLIIGVIPFTRFLHFLVYPIGYFFRRPQVVIWNRDAKEKRSTKDIAGQGVRPSNN